MATELPARDLPWTGERYVPQIGGEIELEHLHRYHWAARFSSAKRVLDIACGEGYGSEILARSAARVIGVDLSEDAIVHAARKYRSRNLEFLVGSCHQIPVPEGQIDLVVSFETIEHHDRHQEMMREIKRVLSPEGVLIISSPDKYVYSDLADYKNEFHVKELYAGEFESLLKEHFANVKVLGQRVAYGSVIASDGAEGFFSFDSEQKAPPAVGGIEKAIFNLAIASDGLVPATLSSIYEQNVAKSIGHQALQREIEARGSKIAELVEAERLYQEGVTAISQLRKELANRETAISELRKELADRETIELANRETETSRLRKELAKRETEKLANLESVISQLQEELAKSRLGTSEAEKKIEQLKASLSWRLSWPFRLVRDRLAAAIRRHASSFPKILAERASASHNSQHNIIASLFDEGYYTALYPEASGGCPVKNYLEKGWKEGFKPHPLFDPSWYLQENQDVAQAGVEPLEHYIRYGWREGRSPHPLFDVRHYLSQAPDLVDKGFEPIAHFLRHGVRVGLKPHSLFDPVWYADFNRHSMSPGENALTHYIKRGWKEGRDPHPLFDSSFYLEENPDVAKAGEEPLGHYLKFGWREGRSPHPLFDVRYYLSQAPEVGEQEIEPVGQFLKKGAQRGLKPHPLFDPVWYAAYNRRSMSPEENALMHYVTRGWKENCDPNPYFSISLYLEANPEVRSRNEDPLVHYLRHSRSEPVYLMPEIRPEPLGAVERVELDVKAIALYLPQYHRIPENDAWWGEGFTEWTNVRRGRPQFWGHYQPHVPHPDIGYYDLIDASVLEKQAQMARHFGIYGFCFYYYWFNGRRLLEMPTDRLLSSGRPDFPFCFCWANENWTRRWDGEEREVLMGQEHSYESDEQFIQDILPALRDRRYIRINGRPLLAIYRPGLLPDARATFAHWREFCRREGLGEIYLAGFNAFDLQNPEPLGLDAAVEFPPHHSNVTKTDRESLPVFNDFCGEIYDYRKIAENMLKRSVSNYILFRGVMPSWDNTARRQIRGTIWTHSEPQSYCRWLHRAVLQTRRHPNPDERLIFINSWNEWAEGAHLEPDEWYGYAWLNATRLALEAGISRRNSGEPYVLVISHDAAMAGAQLLLLNLLREWEKRSPFAVRVICVGDGELRAEFEKCFPTLTLADFTSETERDQALAKFLNGSPRVIYSSTVVNGPLLAKLRPFGVKIVTHSHELQKSIERWAPGEIMAATLKNSDFFLAGSAMVAENLSAAHGVAKDHLGVVNDFIEPWGEWKIPNEGAKVAIREEFGIELGHIVVFGCGTTDWRKGPDLFFEIARLACSQDTRLKFVWIGGDPAPFMEKVLNAGLEGRVLFVGNRKESRRYYYAGHIFLLSSREDPSPLVAIEAADAGLPIVCFERAGDIPGFVGEECGIAVPYEDVRGAAEAVVRLAGDAELRHVQGEEGRRRVMERHSSASAALQIEALFDRLVQEPQLAFPRAKARKKESLVSVIVPNYNHEKYLPERLRSISGQTYENMEIILLDDASTDNSQATLQKFSNEESRARFIPSTQNSGSTFKQWRKGLSQARGRYVWIAESDDVAEAAFLETLVEKLEANPGLSLAYCQLKMVSPNGEMHGTPDEPWLTEIDPLRWKADFVNDGIDEIRRSLVVKNTILNASGVVFRNVEGIADLVDDSMRLCADWLFWVRLLQRGGVAYVANPLSRWRLQSSNARNRPPGELEWAEGERVLVETAEILKLTPAERDRILLNFLRKCWKWRTDAA
jgi:glycosyltransferase involved in cell wall biosynthesis/SAM-dependent methyltransferase